MRPLILPHGGYGLGNDLIPLGKAYLLAKECNGYLMDISWRDNKRGYNKYFNKPFCDPFLKRILWRTLPRIAFPTRINATSISHEIKNFCASHDLYKSNKPRLITVTGIDGGPATAQGANNYILNRLLSSRFTLDNLLTIGSYLDPSKLSVGIHIRLGDFWEIGSRSYSGVVNTRLPGEWYFSIVSNITKIFGHNNVQFLLCSDDPWSKELAEIEKLANCYVISRLPNSDISDLLALAQSDLLVCSSSSYSMWAALLGSSYYIWYKPNLLEVKDGYCLRLAKTYNYLDQNVTYPPSSTMLPSIPFDLPNSLPVFLSGDRQIYRGYPVDDTGYLPAMLIDMLETRCHTKNISTDLVRGGVFKPFV